MMSKEMDPEALALLFRALVFAAHKHRGQTRKGAERHPYINHPITVASILIHEGQVTDPAVLCAAFLHDTVEDTDTTLEELEAEFGPVIAGLVREVTDDKSLEKPERKRLQVEHAPHLSPGAALVKLADKIANLRDIAAAPPVDWDAVRKREYHAWAKRVVDGLRHVHPGLASVFDAAHGAGEVLADGR